MNLDASTWKEFAYPEIFEIRKGFYNKKPEESGLGNIPFIGASAVNQGVTSYHTLDEIREASKTGDENNAPLGEKMFPANAVCVTNNGSVGYAYFHDEPFTCSHDVNPLYRLKGEFNRYTGTFVANVIMADKYRWDYGRKWRPERMQYSKIKLPVTFDGEPDWQWMEDYVKSLHHEPIKTSNHISHSEQFDISEWKWFELGGKNGLFDIRKGKRLTAEDQTEGSTPYVGAIDSNNGVANYIKQEAIHKENTISLSYNGSVGEAFYQPTPYWATDDVNALYLKSEYGELSPAIALFICTVLKLEKYRYSYGRKWTLDNMEKSLVRLPVDLDGNPDWKFMQAYIESLPYGDRIEPRD
mgnify:CR=1 FL=1